MVSSSIMEFKLKFNLYLTNNSTSLRVLDDITKVVDISFLAQLVERVTSNDEVSRSSRLEGIWSFPYLFVCFNRIIWNGCVLPRNIFKYLRS